MSKLDVKVGDYIYTQNRFSRELSIFRVDRLTKTLAVCSAGRKERRFRLSDGQVPGSPGYRITYGYKAEEKRLKKYRAQQAKGFIERNLNSMSEDLLISVRELIESELKADEQ